jgi:asparagine synthase (glutamine-hydrolysing)
MCGIFAFFSRRHHPISETQLQRAIRTLHHRGPDGQRHWIAQDKRVGLGHARLSIIDLVTGDQPIASQDGRSRIVANGEFYDYEAIRRELAQSGHQFRTRSDSEIALHLYDDVGSQCLHRLRGEFAFIIWDEANRTLFAARDRFGIKPLFYAFHNETLYLASEVKALFAAGVPARWNVEAIWRGNEHGGSQSHTLYDGVFQVPAGHFLLASDESFKLTRYWDFNYPSVAEDSRPRSDADCAAELRRALEESVRLRLRADVPVACYLSGGLDSCAVLGIAAQYRTDPIRAFTLTFDHQDYNEEPQAKEMAAKAGAEFTPIPIRQDDLADHFENATFHAETLSFNAHGVAKYLLSRAVRDAGYKVVLTGEGSDEILGGYAHFRRDMLLYDNEGQDPAAVTELLSNLERLNTVSRGMLLPHGKAAPLSFVSRVLGFVPSWMETFSSSSMKWRELLDEGVVKKCRDREPFYGLLSEVDVRGQLKGRSPVHQSLYLWAKTLLPNYILTQLGDRMEMAHSVEGRVPFLDHHVVEQIRSQPVRNKIRGTTEKFILREAVRDVITDTVYRRQKHPFLSPPSTLNPEGKLFTLVQDKLRGKSLAAVAFLDQKKVVRLLDSLKSIDSAERAVADQVLMALLNVCVLQERFNPVTA